MKQPCVYVLTNKNKTVLYIGVTSSLETRIYQHRNETFEGFSKKYKCKYLVYYEQYEDMENAIIREKKLKGWIRAKKEELISSINPEWKDLSLELFASTSS